MTYVLASTIFLVKLGGVASYLKSRGELRHFRGVAEFCILVGGSLGGGEAQHPIPHYDEHLHKKSVFDQYILLFLR